MRFLIAILFFFVTFATAITFEEDARIKFSDFKEKYQRFYSNPGEESHRFEIFKSNLGLAAEYQRFENAATFGVTQFSDLSPEEFRHYYLMPKMNLTELPDATLPVPELDMSVQIPDSFDWSSKGAVTPVYNQARCGSCWAFSATETIESYNALAGHGLTKLSMQQVVDCDRSSYGCNGGWTYNAYKYVISAGGIDTYTSYPYVGYDEQCKYNPSSVGARLKGWGYVTQSRDENAMANYLYTKGPISVCVDASSWQFYQGGVLQRCGGSIDHCVQATGFLSEGGIPAWNVRNSWGTGWGVSGYIKIARNHNLCAIAQVPTYVSV